ncbi:hypothetical protein [Motilibacter deserti]|nr:hypothetical protein [Motilibacter deserti]
MTGHGTMVAGKQIVMYLSGGAHRLLHAGPTWAGCFCARPPAIS